MTQNHLFCFGYGYCCDYLGYDLLSNHRNKWRISGTTQDAEKAAQMKYFDIKPYIFDDQTPLTDPQLFLKDTTHLILSTPPDDDGDVAFNAYADDILAVRGNLKWIGYLSSTGVYGDRDGELVDETSETIPNSQRGSRRRRAEKQWLDLAADYNLPLHVFRLSGIYGPGRSALDSVRAGYARRIEKPGHAFSRIHVDDIVQVIMASMENPNPGSIYNLSDDEAAPSHEVIAYACELLGIDPPPIIPFDEADMSPMARSFYQDNKRVHNGKIKEELGIRLKCPNYKIGLQNCLEAEAEHEKRRAENDPNAYVPISG